jgi:hypothetical protein
MVEDMTGKLDTYASVGLCLISLGAPFASYCYWVIHSIPLTALGIALAVLGWSVLLIPQSPVPADIVRGVFEDACVNVEVILEEFDAHERAWYLPPRDGRVFCFAPLVACIKPAVVWAASQAPVRLLTAPLDVNGVMVCPPGSEVLRLSQLRSEVGLEEAMVYVLIDYLEGAESVKAVREGSRINVFIGKPRLRTEFPRFNSVLGSLPVSVLGCVAAQVLKVPVRVVEERAEERGVWGSFEVLTAG